MLGFRTALSWLTVLPVRGPDDVDRTLGRKVITAAPLVGIVLGAVVALIAYIAAALDLPVPAVGFVAVAGHALLTRGMHIDGLSDVMDGLGCYGGPERAREVMKSGGAGPFGVASLVVVLGLQAATIGELSSRGNYLAIAIAVFAGRVAVVASCRAGTRAASETGFGSLVAGTICIPVIALWWTVAVVVGAFAVDMRWWQGSVVVAVALVINVAVARHCVRRFGGLVGDVLGANIELATTLVLIGLLIG